MAALISVEDFDSTHGMMRECADRFDDTLGRNHIMPVNTDDIEDALAVRNGKYTNWARFFQTTTLLPLLGTVAALIGDQEVLDQLNTEVVPNLKGVTMERWYPQATLQTLTGSDSYVNNVGVSRAIAGFRGSPAEEIEASVNVPPHSAQPEDFAWHSTPWEVLIALSARLHRHPLPTWYLAKLAGVQPSL